MISLPYSDTMCGQLFCEPGDYQGRVTGVRITIVTVGVFVGGQSRSCQYVHLNQQHKCISLVYFLRDVHINCTMYLYRGFTTDPGTDIVSPGLVSDGTKCSEGHVSTTLATIHHYTLRIYCIPNHAKYYALSPFYYAAVL